jgi:cation:H+ antiporter
MLYSTVYCLLFTVLCLLSSDPFSNMPQHAVLFALGLLVLAVGGMCFAFGFAKLGRRSGVSSFAIGLIAAGLGTAAAAMAFNITAVAHGRMRLAVGNIVGVNIANIGLVLGLAALVRPLTGTSQVIASSITILLCSTLPFWFLGRNNELSPVGSGVLLVVFILALTYLERIAQDEPESVRMQFSGYAGAVWLALIIAAVGLVALIVGAEVAVSQATKIVKESHIQSQVLGATAAAFGCSLPGLVVALRAARRGRPDVVLATSVGACLFNLLFVVGVVGLAVPLVSSEPALQITPRALMNEIPALAILSMLLLTVLWNGLEVPRWEGATLLVAYAGFLVWQIWL